MAIDQAPAPAVGLKEERQAVGVFEQLARRRYVVLRTFRRNGTAVDTQEMKQTLPMILQWDESFDIGSDTLTGVNDADYQPPFALTAKLNRLTLTVDRPQLSQDDIKKLQNAEAIAVDGNPIQHIQPAPH